MDDQCDKCKTWAYGIGVFAAYFRETEIKEGRPDPGNLCGVCAGNYVAHRIADEILGPMRSSRVKRQHVHLT